jgi:hypothetical protein
MKKFYSLFLMLILATVLGRAQHVAILASPVTTEPDVYDADVLKIQNWIHTAWTGITDSVFNVASIGDWTESRWAQYDAVVMTESGGSSSHGKVSPIGVKTCPIVCLKAYAIKKAWPQWNLITGDATNWFQMVKDSSQTDYDHVYKGVVAADHSIFGNYWGVGDEFTWTTLYNENQGDEAHVQTFDLSLSSAPVAAASTKIATNKFVDDQVNIGTTTVDGWLWAMDEVPDSSYKKTVIWGVHHMYMTNTTDTFRIILQNSLAWVLGHDIPNVKEEVAINDYSQLNLGLSVYPNPVTATSFVKFTLPQPMAVTVIINDALGRVVYTQDGVCQAGKQHLSIDGSSLTSGIYVCQIVGEGCTQSVKFIVK